MNDKDDSSPSGSDVPAAPDDFSFLNDATQEPVDAADVPNFSGITSADNPSDVIAPPVNIAPESDAPPMVAEPTPPPKSTSAKKAADASSSTKPASSKLPSILGGLSALVIGGFFLWPSQDPNEADEEVVDQGIPFVDPTDDPLEADAAAESTPDVSKALFGISAEESKKKKKAAKDKSATDSATKTADDTDPESAE